MGKAVRHTLILREDLLAELEQRLRFLEMKEVEAEKKKDFRAVEAFFWMGRSLKAFRRDIMKRGKGD